MAVNAKDITLTNHAKDRLRERHDRYLLRYTNPREFEMSCYELLDLATFTNRHLNDARFMLILHEKYGYDEPFLFKEYKNALFVIRGTAVVTVLDTDEHVTSRQHGRVRRF